MRVLSAAILGCFVASLSASSARAMCGCMLSPAPKEVARAQVTKNVTNTLSKVILVREGDRTVMTFANDFSGAASDFGVIVPVPTEVQKDDVSVADSALFEGLEDATAPTVLEREEDACNFFDIAYTNLSSSDEARHAKKPLPLSLGVKVEGRFTKGNFDITVVGGDGDARIVEWLRNEGFAVPDAAADVLRSYLAAKMHFFLARVRLDGAPASGPTFLPPLQVRYTSPKFMLPIRLGRVNAPAGAPQELLLHVVSAQGRVEPTNYRSAKLYTARDPLPDFIKKDVNGLYRAVFKKATVDAGSSVVFTEAVQPVDDTTAPLVKRAGASNAHAFVTRLHFQFDAEHFPEDLVLQETGDQRAYNVVFNTTHHLARITCLDEAESQSYLYDVHKKELAALAALTGWDQLPPPP